MNKNIVLSIRMEKLSETSFKFDVMKTSLTPIEEKALKIFIENMILKEQYQDFIPIEDVVRLIK